MGLFSQIMIVQKYDKINEKHRKQKRNIKVVNVHKLQTH